LSTHLGRELDTCVAVYFEGQGISLLGDATVTRGGQEALIPRNRQICRQLVIEYHLVVDAVQVLREGVVIALGALSACGKRQYALEVPVRLAQFRCGRLESCPPVLGLGGGFPGGARLILCRLLGVHSSVVVLAIPVTPVFRRVSTTGPIVVVTALIAVFYKPIIILILAQKRI
jgi:hypothetical protein